MFYFSCNSYYFFISCTLKNRLKRKREREDWINRIWDDCMTILHVPECNLDFTNLVYIIVCIPPPPLFFLFFFVYSHFRFMFHSVIIHWLVQFNVASSYFRVKSLKKKKKRGEEKRGKKTFYKYFMLYQTPFALFYFFRQINRMLCLSPKPLTVLFLLFGGNNNECGFIYLQFIFFI